MISPLYYVHEEGGWGDGDGKVGGRVRLGGV